MMATFTNTVRLLVDAYKQILKNHIGPTACNQKLKDLGLKKKILKHDTEIALYHKLKKLVHDLELWLESNTEVAESSQFKDFHAQTKHLLQHFYIDNDRVVHVHQKASRALVRSIQLMTAHKDNPTTAIYDELHHCGYTVAHYGHEDHHKMYQKALQKHAEEAPHLFRQLLNAFKDATEKSKYAIEESCIL